MTLALSKSASYVAFIGAVALSLSLVRPKPDLISISYEALASSYSSLLVGLSGFSITVLAVLLGLEAIDANRLNDARRIAHLGAVRQVAVSLAVASVCCFAGANLLGEVSALSRSVESGRQAAQAKTMAYLKAAGLSDARIAELSIELDRAGRTTPFADGSKPADWLGQILKDSKPSLARRLASEAASLDRVSSGSVRRHFVIATVAAYLASFLILQSLSFLLLIRFPKSRQINALQGTAVLGFAAVLLIKLLHIASYGLSNAEFYASRALIILAISGTCLLYAPRLRAAVRQHAGTAANSTPLLPYYFALGTCLSCMALLAGTFSNYGPLTPVDRLLVGLGATVSTGLLLSVQIERPAIECLLEAIDEAD